MMSQMMLALMMPFLACIASTEAFVVGPRRSTSTIGRRSTHHQHNLMAEAAMDFASDSSSVPSFMIDSCTTMMLSGGLSTLLQANDGIDQRLQSFLENTQPIVTAVKQFFTPDVEAEVVTDVNHVISDLSVFFQPTKSTLKIYSIVGRLLVLTADYIPDHCIRPEEMLVQVVLVSMGVRDLLKDPSLSPFAGR